MKTDRFIKDLADRLARLDSYGGGNAGNGKANNAGCNISGDDDEFYLQTGLENPRMAYYRYYRVNNCQDEYRKQTCECVNDWTSQDELDYSLKRKLRMTPEQRYEQKKRSCLYDSSSCGPDKCAADCRYQADEDGRIEDQAVIEEHRELEADLRKQNKIVNIEIENNDYQKFLKIWDNQ